MDLEAVINLISNNGIGIVCVGFMMYFINTIMKDNNVILEEIQKTLVSVQLTLSNLSERIDKLEDNK